MATLTTRRYRSNLTAPDFERCFIHTRELDPSVYANPQGHTILCDPEVSPACGYVTHDEAAILYQLAVQTGMLALAADRYANWLEIGSNTGWSTAHIAAAPDVFVTGLEPNPVAIKRAAENLTRCGMSPKVHLVQECSDDCLAVPRSSPIYDGVFIDGGHEPGQPERDARNVLPLLRDTAVVVLHDAIGRPVQEAARYLVHAGFEYRAYRTPQMLTVLWRGSFVPPMHVPDPWFAWDSWARGQV